MYPLIDKLVAAEDFALKVWQGRYHGGVWAGCAPRTGGGVDLVEDLTHAGDHDALSTQRYVEFGQWMPFAWGKTMGEALAALEARLAFLPPDQIDRRSEWSSKVREALAALEQANDNDRIEGIEDTIPRSFAEAIGA